MGAYLRYGGVSGGSPTQSIGPLGWNLVGSVTTPEQLLRVWHSLKLVRQSDHLSSGIRSAWIAKSVVPVIVINTPNSRFQVENATIVNYAFAPAPPISLQSLEEIQITFQKITYLNTLNQGVERQATASRPSRKPGFRP